MTQPSIVPRALLGVFLDPGTDSGDARGPHVRLCGPLGGSAHPSSAELRSLAQRLLWAASWQDSMTAAHLEQQLRLELSEESPHVRAGHYVEGEPQEEYP